MALALLTGAYPNHGKVDEEITLVGTDFVETPQEEVYCRKAGEVAWVEVDPTQIAWVSATAITLTLKAADFTSGGLWDIGICADGVAAPTSTIAQLIYFYAAGVDDPDAFIKGAPEATYIDGEYVGQTHGGADLEHAVETSDIVSDQETVPLRTSIDSESWSFTTQLGEATLENWKRVHDIGQSITENADGTRVLTFGGEGTDLTEHEVMVILPGGSGKLFALTFYRCTITAPGTMSFSKEDQVTFPLTVNILSDTSRAVGDRIGRIEEYTAA